MLKHRRKLLAAFGGVLILAGTPAMAAEFRAVLNGDNEIGPGDADGWGRIKIDVDDTLNTVCADVEVRSVGDVTAVTIHRGGTGVDGPPVITLDRPDDNDSNDCDNVGDELADEIQANPAGFYATVATAEHPEGAIRGQFVPSSD